MLPHVKRIILLTAGLHALYSCSFFFADPVHVVHNQSDANGMILFLRAMACISNPVGDNRRMALIVVRK
jgi:hypothetical protein